MLFDVIPVKPSWFTSRLLIQNSPQVALIWGAAEVLFISPLFVAPWTGFRWPDEILMSTSGWFMGHWRFLFGFRSGPFFRLGVFGVRSGQRVFGVYVWDLELLPVCVAFWADGAR